MITRKTLIVAVVAALAVLAPLAALRPMAQAKTETQPQTNTVASAPATNTPGRDAGGVSVQLVGVARGGTSPASSKSWWDASGRLLPKPLPVWANGTYSDPKHSMSYTIAFRVKSPGNVPVNLLFEPKNSLGFGSSYNGSMAGKITAVEQSTEAQIDAENGGYRALSCGFPVGMTQSDIHLGIGEGPWSTASGINCLFGPVTSTGSGSIVTASLNGEGSKSPSQTNDLRIIAVDNRGNKKLPNTIDDVSENSLEQVQAHFNLPPASIKSVQLETRPYHWIEFNHVALRPRQEAAGGQ